MPRPRETVQRSAECFPEPPSPVPAFLDAAMSSQRCPPALDPGQQGGQEGRIRALIRRLGADPHLVEDLTQETWLAALRYTAAARFLERAWLGRVAQNFA